MLSFHVKFVQTDRRTTVKQYAPDLSIRRHKKVPLYLDQDSCKNHTSKSLNIQWWNNQSSCKVNNIASCMKHLVRGFVNKEQTLLLSY